MARSIFLKFNGRIRRSFVRDLTDRDVDDSSFLALFKQYWNLEDADRELVNRALNKRKLLVQVCDRYDSIVRYETAFFAEAVANMDQLGESAIRSLSGRMVYALDNWCYRNEKKVVREFFDRVLAELKKRGLVKMYNLLVYTLVRTMD